MTQIKKPQFAYLLFMEENRAAITAEVKSAAGPTVQVSSGRNGHILGMVGRRGGAMWKALSEKDKVRDHVLGYHY